MSVQEISSNLNLDIWNKCKDLLDQGYDYKYICENVDIDCLTLRSLMNFHNYNYSSIKRKHFNDDNDKYRYNMIKEMLSCGSTYKEIGSKLGISGQRVRQLILKWDLISYRTCEFNKIKDDLLKKVVNLLNSGMYLSDISRKLDISYGSLVKKLKRLNIDHQSISHEACNKNIRNY